MRAKLGARAFIMVAAVICVVTVITTAMIYPTNTGDAAKMTFEGYGYELTSRVVSEGFNTSQSSVKLSVSDGQKVDYTKGSSGLKVNFKGNGSSLTVERGSTSADAVRCVLNASAVDSDHFLDLKVKFLTKEVSSWYYGITIRMTPNKVFMYPDVWLGSGTPNFQGQAFLYDVAARGTLDLLVEVRDGNIIVGIDGLETTIKTDHKVIDNLMFGSVTLASNRDRWSTPAPVTLERLDIANGGNVIYHDRLHKTVTAWGHDFTLALQIHADQANPAQLDLFRQLTEQYGVRGEFEAWMDTSSSDSEYSIRTSEDYANALDALQEAGWDIGLHAVTSNPSTRAQILPLIDEFEGRYGPLVSWVDHGNVQQDIWQKGKDPSSPYYISDLLVDGNVMIWVNEEEHSHAKVQDLNLNTVRYRHDSYPGLDLMRSSPYGFLEETNDWWSPDKPVTAEDLSGRQRVYASNSAVLIWHDYTWRMMCVEDGGVNYSLQSHKSMGYAYEPINVTDFIKQGANVHPDGTWKFKQVAVEYFKALSEGYDVWHATPREIYDRSIAMEQLVVSENDSAVTIKNNGPTALEGLTLYTKQRPDYCLESGGTRYYASQGAESWKFVIPEVPANSTIVLSKSETPSSAPSVTGGQAHVVMWGDADELYLQAVRGGPVNLRSNISGGNGLKLVDLETGHESSFSDGSSVDLMRGRDYKITPA